MIPQPPGLVTTEWIDLGLDHSYKFLVWDLDFSLAGNQKWAHLAHLIRTQPIVGASVKHRCKTESGWHEGGIYFKTELTEAAFKDSARWDVLAWSPLHTEPSLQSHCPCNDHGFIRGGKWERA
jgi:hypothetical protein